MTDSYELRIKAAVVEDLVVHVFQIGLDVDSRLRVRARIQQLQRHNWPATLSDDPDLRKGQTLDQCFGLVAGFALLDAFLSPTTAVRVARDNAKTLRWLMAQAVSAYASSGPGSFVRGPETEYGVLIGSALDDLGPSSGRYDQTDRLRIVQGRDLAQLWSANSDFPQSGARVIVDMAGIAARAVEFLLAGDHVSRVDLASLTVLTRHDRQTHGAGYSPTGRPVGDRYRTRRKAT